MKLPRESPLRSLQLFEPADNTLYTLEAVEHLTHLPRRTILICYKHGLVSPVADPECGGYYFNDEGIRALRRIEYLRSVCGVNLAGIKMILALMDEVERLRGRLPIR